MKKGRAVERSRPEIGVVMGSDSDWAIVQEAVRTIRSFGIECEARVASAHRTPEQARRYARTAAGRGIKVIIAAAGGAAHLGGVIAAHTTLPVIGIPVSAGALNGLDALLSTVQMPAGIPVAAVSLGSAGPVNAAILAVQILAAQRAGLSAALKRYKKGLEKKVAAGDAKVRKAAADL